jgi:anti-sigma factor RsiW
VRAHVSPERLSAYLDDELEAGERRALQAHLAACESCAALYAALCHALELLASVPRLVPTEPIARRVRDRLELERRGPGLALLFQPAGRRPLLLPSLVPAALVLLAALAGFFLLQPAPRWIRMRVGPVAAWQVPAAPAGSEANPLFPSAEVSAPRVTSGTALVGRLPMPRAEGDLFLESVVARDGSVSAVTLLQGDRREAGPVLAALLQERFEPGRYRGRPVAVSVYRLIAHLEVREPLT